jgi:WD40 repeat protein
MASGAQSLAYSPNGRTLAANWLLDFDFKMDLSQIIVYDAQTGKLKSSLNAIESPTHIIFSPDGKTITYAGKIALDKIGFDANDLPDILPNANSSENFSRDMNEQRNNTVDFFGVAFSSDGKTLYKLHAYNLNAYTYPELKFLPAKSRELKVDPDAPVWTEFVALGENGSIIEAEHKKPEITLIVTPPQGEAARFKLPYKIEDTDFPRISAVVSRNGETMAVRYGKDGGSDKQITFWDLKNRKQLGVFTVAALDKHSENNFYMVDSFAVSPDGRKIAARFLAAGDDAKKTHVIVRDVLTRKESLIEFENEDGSDFAETFVFSPDSKHLATLSTVLSPASFAPRVQIWDVETGKLIRHFE